MAGQVSLFDLRTLLGIVKQMPKEHTFLRDTFFPTTKTFLTKEVDIDIIGADKRTLAPFVHRSSGGSFSYRDGFSTKSYQPARIAPMMITTAEEAKTRAAGETIYSQVDPLQRMNAIVAENLKDLDRRITRREEWMAAQALFTGKIEMKGEGVNDVLNMWPSSNKPETEVTTKWDQPDAKPFEDLITAVDKVGEQSGRTVNKLIVGRKVLNILMNFLVKDGTLDPRRINLGSIQPQAPLPSGAQYIGTLLYPHLDIYAYTETFVNDAGQTKPLVPDNIAFLASDGAMTTRAYGVVDIIDENNQIQFVEGARVANSWVQRDTPAGRVVQMVSHPLMIVNEPNAFHVLKVLNG